MYARVRVSPPPIIILSLLTLFIYFSILHIDLPILILHSEDDIVVPFYLGEKVSLCCDTILSISESLDTHASVKNRWDGCGIKSWLSVILKLKACIEWPRNDQAFLVKAATLVYGAVSIMFKVWGSFIELVRTQKGLL